MLSNELPFPLDPQRQTQLLRECKLILKAEMQLAGDDYNAVIDMYDDVSMMFVKQMASILKKEGHHTLVLSADAPSSVPLAAGIAITIAGDQIAVSGDWIPFRVLLLVATLTDVTTTLLTRTPRSDLCELVHGWRFEDDGCRALEAREAAATDTTDFFTGQRRSTGFDVYADAPLVVPMPDFRDFP
ncbi:hypothetical protein [Streptomyces goshikiensis]|uniref:hypothetical protein n=1 Tax=Streptomyces goshikiensis TaxID=1942 RepID=UPI0036B2539D